MLPEVVDALHRVPGGNPASPHWEGRGARAALDLARDTAANALGVDPAEIVFTSNGTEAINLALLGTARRLSPGDTIVTWAAEHQAVLACTRRLQVEGHRVEVLGVDGTGRNSDVDLPGAALVSTSLVNNEVGTLQPRPQAAGAVVHLDACQGPQWLPVDLRGIELASFSGHKIGAGRGGVLFIRSGRRLEPLQYGGPQERGLRAGHEDVAGAVAMAAALQSAATQRAQMARRAEPLAARLRRVLLEAGGRLTGPEQGQRAAGLPNHASAVFPGVRGEDLLLALDLSGIAASSGSACASGSLDPSHVLLAMGLSLEDSLSSLRLTVGWSTTPEDIDRAEAVIRRVLPALVPH